ncbi:MAG: serine/threonine-protein kinase, partial [Planctomycetota bacterium JB042]
MPPDRWDRLEAIFHDALERRAEERDAFVEAASGGDRGLAEEVRRMLAADADAEGLVAPSPGALARKIATSAVLEVGERLGAWRVVRPIASGGMGSVFLAERDDRRFEQRVAIKVIRRELVAEGTTERFRRERRLLARLRHPNVARLLDGGETDDGRPYLVMEHVDGEPIDAYCDGRRLAIERRIELFRDVCAAVDEAHRNLVVHRDLKPSNILVTADGTPKLLDFGIAKLLEEPDDLEPDLTRTGNRPMTPGYASPEQVRAEPTTTATDVYSLGVVLYELLTGQRPYGPTVTGGYELERAICETTPTRPSDAVAAPSVGSPERPPDAAGRLRSSRPEALRRRLAGDLDNIVLRAMQKDPTRRYPSAGALGDDLRRHLLDLPVAARPDSVAYRARKFVKRNRLAAAMIGVAATAVIGGTAGAVRWAVVAERERERAAEAAEGERLQSDRFRAVNAFLGDLLSAASPAGLGTDVPVGAVLDRAAARIDDELDDPSVEMDVRLTIGRTYSAIGRHADAALHFEAALALARRHLPADDPALVPVLDLLAGERIDTGAYDE